MAKDTNTAAFAGNRRPSRSPLHVLHQRLEEPPRFLEKWHVRAVLECHILLARRLDHVEIPLRAAIRRVQIVPAHHEHDCGIFAAHSVLRIQCCLLSPLNTSAFRSDHP
jgi:hypothetical protein